MLDLSQADLARKVNCSLSMLRKIESDNRRPSTQLAELLAVELKIDESQRDAFLQLARGNFLQETPNLIQVQDTSKAIPDEPGELAEPAPFVAREREISLLHEHCDRAISGQGRIIFIAGEAGRGKTSLMNEFARQIVEARSELIVAAGSSDVYTGRSDPLLPFRDVFRLLAGDFENHSMRRIIDKTLATRLVQMVPAFCRTLLDYGPHLIDTLISGRMLEDRLAHNLHQDARNVEILFRLKDHRTREASFPMQDLLQVTFFDEISAILNSLSQRQPLVLMLDDLHWIDPSSAALLGHLAMRMKQSPMLIIGSYRPEDLAQSGTSEENRDKKWHPLHEVLSESQRQFGSNRVDLDHHEPGEALEFVTALVDRTENQFSHEFRQKLARLTEGHPLFVVELLQDMQERGDILRGEDGVWKEADTVSWENLPARVEGVIEKQLTRLPAELLDLLTVASIQGETFFAEVIARVRRTDLLELTRRLNVDLDRHYRLIFELGVEKMGGERLSQYRFRHHLFQKYLYGRLAAAERMYLHEAVGNALELLFAGSNPAVDIPAAQLARHFHEAHLGLKAAGYLLLAGRKAMHVLAFNEAARQFEQGLDELNDLIRTAEIDRLEYQLSLEMARALWHNGDVIESIDAYKKAMEIARVLKDPHALALAALSYEEPRWRLNLDANLSQQFLREALTALGEEESGLRVRLLVNLSRCLLASGEQAELRLTMDKALRIAHKIDDPLALCDALRIHVQIDRRPEIASERLEAIKKMIAMAESIGDRERLADGLDLYVYDLLELGQIDQVDELIEAQRQVAQEIKQPFQLHVAAVFRTMRAILRGEFEKAERLAGEASEISRQIGIAEMDGIYGIQMFTIRREQGRIHEIAPIVKWIADKHPDASAWRPGLALIYQILGRRKECQAVFEDLSSGGFAFLSHDSLRVATLAYLSEVCTYLGDSKQAGILYRLLRPYNGRSVVVGGATACFGAVTRYSGMLAMVMSDWETAERHFQDAIKMNTHMEAWPWLAHSQFAYLKLLLKRGRDEDRERVDRLLQRVFNTARRLGMAYLLREAEGLQARYELNLP